MGRGVRIVLTGLIVVLMAMVSACAHTPPVSEPAAEQDSVPPQQRPRVPNEYLVMLAPDVNESIISEYYGRFGIKHVHALEEDTYLLILSDDPGPQEMTYLIQNEARIKMVQPNLILWDYH